MSMDLILRGGTIVRADEDPFRADVAIRHGMIAGIFEAGTEIDGPEEDVSGLHILPGVVDPHVHVGFAAGLDEYRPDTRAAILGGTTTIFNIIMESGSYAPVVQTHLDRIAQDCFTDVGLHLTLMTEDHVAELPKLNALGIRSFKYFMNYRGTEGDYLGVAGTDDGLFFAILEGVKSHGGVLMIHPENIEVVFVLRDRLQLAGRTDLKAWGESRPPFTEAEAIVRAAYLADAAGCGVYFVHLSGEEALTSAHRIGHQFPDLESYFETCTHFLTHHEDMPIGPLGKVNPPLRRTSDNEAMWQAIADGTIDTVGSDHNARRIEKKAGDIWQASSGFPGTATILPVLITKGYHERGIPLQRLVAVASRNPARIFGCGDRKGDIRVGMDADLAVVDLSFERKPDPEWLGTYSDYSLYQDESLRGWPKFTFLRGHLVQRNGEVVEADARGRHLFRDGGRLGS